MPDSKITALTSISTSTDPANDPLVIVDLSDTSMAASGTTKKVTLNQLLGASGTATLASATITGDLTVDTSTLKVDSANNRVGIRTASPAEPLTVDNSSGVTTGAIRIYATDQSHSRLSIQNGNGQAYHLVAGNPGASNAGFALYDNTGAATRWYVDNTGVHTWSNVGGVAGTAMTLNANGLGIGVTPSAGKGCLQLVSGINFPATQVASSDANTLDDYEEGTWTIGLTFGGGSTGITTSANTGRYTKVGRQVTVIGYLALTNKGSSTGSAVITGLPFASPNSLEAFSAVTLRFISVSYTGTIQGLQLINSTNIELDNISDAGVVSSLTDSNFVNSSSIIISCTYTV